jgi:hypothetical protein
VDIAYDGPPGSLIGELTSVDQTGDFSFETPVKDPLEVGRASDNLYPWTSEGGARTVVHIKNTTAEPVWAIVQFRFAGGSYNPDRVRLGPYQTVALDVQKLRFGTTRCAQTSLPKRRPAWPGNMD